MCDRAADEWLGSASALPPPLALRLGVDETPSPVGTRIWQREGGWQPVPAGYSKLGKWPCLHQGATAKEAGVSETALRPSLLLLSFVPRHHRLGVGLQATPADALAAGSRRPASSCHIEPSVLEEPSIRQKSKG